MKTLKKIIPLGQRILDKRKSFNCKIKGYDVSVKKIDERNYSAVIMDCMGRVAYNILFIVKNDKYKTVNIWSV